ncbi:hypothetical protein A2U01_0008482 [Trifolium medium]|uniref:Uncharacterized protein n=1 Tax=Trifolium medium TaxID=97028 RepID=A0A392MKS8_9FABA|nr:hypothetical protein [Trifolium medium]
MQIELKPRVLLQIERNRRQDRRSTTKIRISMSTKTETRDGNTATDANQEATAGGGEVARRCQKAGHETLTDGDTGRISLICLICASKEEIKNKWALCFDCRVEFMQI